MCLTVDYEDIEGGILLKVSVTDTGIGIKEEDLARIFNAFEQSDIFRNRKQEKRTWSCYFEAVTYFDGWKYSGRKCLSGGACFYSKYHNR